MRRARTRVADASRDARSSAEIIGEGYTKKGWPYAFAPRASADKSRDIYLRTSYLRYPLLDVASAWRERRLIGHHEGVSWRSPLARALLTAKVGDTVTLRAPRGPERLEIIAVRYDDLQ